MTHYRSPALGGLGADVFLSRYWQRKPLLIRQAYPDFKAPCTIEQVLALAQDPQLSARLVRQQRGRWSVVQSPLETLPKRTEPAWTVLVQGVDQHHTGVRALLDGFRFIADARLDDVMISYASDGGGVGAHSDSYDVFLLQAQGKRRWRVGKPASPERLKPNQPLKLLANFEAQEEYELGPGDMLYVPPGWGHEGVAVGECTTYSIGFRATQQRQLQMAWLEHLADSISENPKSTQLYKDPPATVSSQETPAQIPEAMSLQLRDWMQTALTQPLASDACEQQQFIGRYLSEPRAEMVFPFAKALGAPEVWWRKACTQGIQLHLASRMLYDDKAAYLNGESVRCAGQDKRWLERLANQRGLAAEQCQALCTTTALPKFKALRAQIHLWAEDGWLALGGKS
jgi:50S ribosomal protein L16 3-hydroxylase